MFFNTSQNQRAKDLIRTSMNNYDENSKLMPIETSKVTLGKLLLNKGELETELSNLEPPKSNQFGGGINVSNDTKDIALLIIVTISLFFVFIVIGNWVDNLLQIDKNDYTKSVGNLTLQLIITMGMLIIPYFIISTYVKNNFLLKYYPLIFSVWVLSLKAQPNLISKFKYLLKEETIVNNSQQIKKGKKEISSTIIINDEPQSVNNQEDDSKSTSIDALFQNRDENQNEHFENQNEHFENQNNHPNSANTINFMSPLLKEEFDNTMVKDFNRNETTSNFSYLS